MENSHTTHTVIIGGGFAGLYLAHHLLSRGHTDFLLVAPDTTTVSDKSYYNIRSRGVKQASLKASISATGGKKCNAQLVNTLLNNIDDEITYLSHLTPLQPSYLGAQVVDPKALLSQLRGELGPRRIHSEVLAIRKQKKGIIVEMLAGIIHCDTVVLCTGGNRARLSDKFADERTQYNMFDIASRVGCAIESPEMVMRHPFYSKGVCIPSDNLYDYDIVDQEQKRLSLTHHLIRAHNAHHRFDDICKEYEKTTERYAVKGKERIVLDIEPHYILGGIRINRRGETTVKHIYALGECAYGMHGEARLGGCSMSEILVMSRVVAEQLIGSSGGAPVMGELEME